MGTFAPFAILGIIFGVIAITSGVGLAGVGMLENQQAPPLETHQVCEEYEAPTEKNLSELFADNPDRDRGPNYGGSTESEKTSAPTSTSEHEPIGPDCEEYTSYTTGGGSPGNSKMGGGSVLALLGGAVVYRSTL